MKAVTITVPSELDTAAAAEAQRRGISKSALYRHGLEAVLPSSGVAFAATDVWHQLGGFGPAEFEVGPGAIGRELYGQ